MNEPLTGWERDSNSNSIFRIITETIDSISSLQQQPLQQIVKINVMPILLKNRQNSIKKHNSFSVNNHQDKENIPVSILNKTNGRKTPIQKRETKEQFNLIRIKEVQLNHQREFVQLESFPLCLNQIQQSLDVLQQREDQKGYFLNSARPRKDNIEMSLLKKQEKNMRMSLLELIRSENECKQRKIKYREKDIHNHFYGFNQQRQSQFL